MQAPHEGDGGIEEEDGQFHGEVIISVSSSEQLASCDHSQLSYLEARRKSRLYNYVYGPYRQHQLLVDSVWELKSCNGSEADSVPGRMLRVGPKCSSGVGNICSITMWYLGLLLPFITICLCYTGYDTWLTCCCAIALCLLISMHSITVFFILHNQKIARRFWFISKVNLDHDCRRENRIVQVTLDNTMSMQFLSAGQKSQIIARLARSKDQKGMMMMCTKSFWISRVQDPLLCCLILIIVSLVALIVNIDLLRREALTG